MVRVAITGAAGRIGRHLVPGLLDAGYDVGGIDVVRPEAPWADRITVADLAADNALATVVAGCDAIVHLAAIAVESDFESAVASHLGLTHRVLEAARQLDIGRVIYASSNHAVGFTPRDVLVTTDAPVRPDSLYGVGKAAAEALCSLYHDRHGLAIACLRIGSFRVRPGSRRELSTWLSVPDAIALVDACLTAPDLGFAIIYGISNNTRAWWDLAPGRSVGYHPVDDAEAWAAEIEATPPTEDDELDARHVGGRFAR